MQVGNTTYHIIAYKEDMPMMSLLIYSKITWNARNFWRQNNVKF